MLLISKRHINLDAKTVTQAFLQKIKDKNPNTYFIDLDDQRNELEKYLIELLDELENIKSLKFNFHKLIEICGKIWHLLFHAAMTNIDDNTKGFNELFNYFKKFAKFEELLYSTDDFYRDHTTHMLWTYFLAEFLLSQEELKEILKQKPLPVEGHDENFRRNILIELKDNILPLFLNLPQSQDEEFNQLLEKITNLKNKRLSLDLEDEIHNIFEKCLKYLKFVAENKNIISFEEFLSDIIDFELSLSDLEVYFKILKKYEIYEEIIEGIKKILYKREIFRQIILAGTLMSSVRCVTFLCHDLGYPLKRIKKISSSITDMLEEFKASEIKEFEFILPQGLKKFLEEILEYISGTFIIKDDKILLKRDQNTYLSLLIDTETKEHGIMSSYILALKVHSLISDFIDFLKIKEVPIRDFNLKAALSKALILKAIALHTCERKTIENLSKLEDFLIFVDFIEEFSRMTRASLIGTRIPQFCSTELEFSKFSNKIEFDIIYRFEEKNERPEDLKPSITFKDKVKFLLKHMSTKIEGFDFNLTVIDPYKKDHVYYEKKYIVEFDSIATDTLKIDYRDTRIKDIKKMRKKCKKELKDVFKDILKEKTSKLIIKN